MIELLPHERGTVIQVRAQPQARKNAIVGEHAGMVRVAVTAAPEKGKANDAILEVLADALGWRGRIFDRISAQECERRDRVHRLWPANVLMREMFAGDGFHPSELLHAMFADAAIDALTP